MTSPLGEFIDALTDSSHYSLISTRKNTTPKQEPVQAGARKTEELAENLLGVLFKSIAKGADKIVWVRKNPPSEDTEGAKKAYYTPNKVFLLFSRVNALREEYDKVKDIRSKFSTSDAYANLACDWKQIEGGERIRGQFTLETEACDRDFEKAINDKEEPIGILQTISLVGNMLSGVDQLHAAGYIHGDLKPENCLVYKDEVSGQLTLKVADFGRAEEVGNEEGSQTAFRPYQGNTRFAPPEGVASKKGEVYSSAMMMMRAFEQQLDGEVMPQEENEKGSVHGSRKGLDKFVLQKSIFPCCENKGTALGRIKNAFYRNKMLGTNREAQADAMQQYATALCERLKGGNVLPDPSKADDLKTLLLDMLKADPNERPTSEDVSERYNNIFPPPDPIVLHVPDSDDDE